VESDPVVTTIISQYGHEALLERAVASWLAQSCGAWRLIIVNDDPRVWFANVWHDGRISVHNNMARRRGQSRSYNMALPTVHTPLVAFMGADDEVLPNRAAVLREAVAWYAADVYYTSALYCRGDECEVYGAKPWSPASYGHGNYVCAGTVAYATAHLARADARFATWMRRGEDYVFFARAAAGARVRPLADVTYKYNLGTGTAGVGHWQTWPGVRSVYREVLQGMVRGILRKGAAQWT